MCDNMNAIENFKNLVQHSRTKHIDIRHHYIRDLVEKNMICIKFIPTEKQIANIFTKALDFERFSHLRKSLGICNIWFLCAPECWVVGCFFVFQHSFLFFFFVFLGICMFSLMLLTMFDQLCVNVVSCVVTNSVP